MPTYQVPGYEGICRECFEPIKNGEGIRLREGGLLFHAKCVDRNPDGHYITQERRMSGARKIPETPPSWSNPA